MAWADTLEVCLFRGVELDVVKVSDPVARRLTAYKYPYQDGADYEDFGREPRETHLTVVFMGDDVEAKLGAFLKVIDDGEAGDFTHPILGTWTARVQKADLLHDASAEDYCAVELSLVEDGAGTELPDVFSVQKLKDDALTLADEAEFDWSSIKPDPGVMAIINACKNAVAKARAFIDKIEDTIASAIESLNELRTSVLNAVEKLRRLPQLLAHKIVRGLLRLNLGCKKVADRLRQEKPPRTVKTLAAAQPLSMVAARQYGSAKRVDEVARQNRIRNPFLIPAGTEVVLYAR
jgi:prophage DNA circulation protein